MKNGKAAGPDDTPAEVWKLLGHRGILILTTLFNRIIADGEVPAACPTQGLLYADDVFLSDEDRGDVQGQTQQWKTRLGDNGMRLNTKKTEYMECGLQIDGSITMDGEDLKKVTEFKYLGSIISSDGDLLPDVRAHITAAWMKWRQVAGVLCDRSNATSPQVQSITDCCLLSCLVWIGVLASHCQARAGSPCDGDAHAVVEPRPDKMGPLHFIGIVAITDKMQEAWLRWYRHVVRSANDSVAKTAMRTSPQGKRPRGRPKKRWMDKITEDMKQCQAWKKYTAEGRNEMFLRPYKHAGESPNIVFYEASESKQ
ncbi:hypothetical protein QTP86_002271 [Hemibagrus guttatus]|nr:hypothetical protein QTP86_002271 [Hemibagrus guttatus]